MAGRTRNIIRLEALYRLAVLKYLHRVLPVILVTEYPKSGASWLAQMLAELTGYDFPRQRFPGFKPSIYHGHYLFKPSSLNTIVFWRDPRDVMVSWYHHCLYKSDKNNHQLVDQIRKFLDIENVDNIRENLPRFIEYSFTASLSPRFSFNDFFDTWYGREDAVHSSYEALKQDPENEVLRIIKELDISEINITKIADVVDKYSFKTLTDRTPGAEDKTRYLRKGIVGDWKNHFSDEAVSIIKQQLGNRLRLLGYVSDDNWSIEKT